MASFQAIMINDLTDPEKFTRKHLLNMHDKYRNIWNAFKINEFSIQYKDAPRISVVSKNERSLIDDEIMLEIKKSADNNKIIEHDEAKQTILQGHRQNLKPLFAKVFNLVKALPEENKTHYTCECGSEVVNCNKSHHLKTTKHLNFINKVEALPEENKTHYTCECGSKVIMSNKTHHLKTVKHLNFINHVPAKPKAETMIDCGCGKTFSLKNKSHHNKTSYHLDWVNCNEI